MKWNCLYAGLCPCAESSFCLLLHLELNIRCFLTVLHFLPPFLSDSFFPLIILAVFFPPSTSPAVPVIYPKPWWAVRWGWINHVSKMTHLHENMKSVKGRRGAELRWPLQNGCTEHNLLLMAKIRWSCVWVSLNYPTFCQKHSPASKLVSDSQIFLSSCLFIQLIYVVQCLICANNQTFIKESRE